MRRFSSNLAAFFLLTIILFTACANNDVSSINTMAGKTPALGSNEKTLKLYFINSHMAAWNTVTAAYSAEYPDVKIESVGFQDRAEYNQKLNTELLAGGGPDVILLTRDTFDSVYKLIESGAFYDMNKIIEKDKTFQIEDYNEAAMDSGVFDKKRYIIPIDFDVKSFITTGKMLRNSDIRFDENNWSLKELTSGLENYRNKVGSGKHFFTSPISFSEYVLSSGLNVVDYKNKKTNFDTPEFVDILTMYKNILYDSSASYEENIYGNQFWNAMKEGSALADGTYFSLSTESLWENNSIISHVFNEEAKIYPVPGYNVNSRYIATPFYYMLTINKNSTYKEAAFNYIKAAISKDLQKDSRICIGIPVNKLAYEEEIQEYSGDKGKNQLIRVKELANVLSIPLSSNLKDAINNIVSGISECVIPDMTVTKFLDEAAMEYVEGKSTLEQTIRSIEQKVNLYLNE